MRRLTPRFRILAAVLAASLLSVGITSVVSASASTPSPTYYACLNAGTLTNVGTTFRFCKAPAQLIAWASESQLRAQISGLATETGQANIQTGVNTLINQTSGLATASSLASLQSGVNALPGQLQGSNTSETLTSLSGLINTVAAGDNLSALQSALSTAIISSAAPLATAAGLASLQSTVNALPGQLQGPNTSETLTSIQQSLQTSLATLQSSVNTLNNKVDTLCSAQGASC